MWNGTFGFYGIWHLEKVKIIQYEHWFMIFITKGITPATECVGGTWSKEDWWWKTGIWNLFFKFIRVRWESLSDQDCWTYSLNLSFHIVTYLICFCNRNIVKDFNYYWNLLRNCFHLLLDCFGHLQTNVFLWIRTCLQYAVPSVVSGIRLLLICEVALGECCDLTSIHRDLTAPPSGFHSCHGVKLTEDAPTDFVVIIYS